MKTVLTRSFDSLFSCRATSSSSWLWLIPRRRTTTANITARTVTGPTVIPCRPRSRRRSANKGGWWVERGALQGTNRGPRLTPSIFVWVCSEARSSFTQLSTIAETIKFTLQIYPKRTNSFSFQFIPGTTARTRAPRGRIRNKSAVEMSESRCTSGHSLPAIRWQVFSISCQR